MESVPYEIERKYLIRRPDDAWLDTVGERSEILQTYLLSSEEDVRARVRMRSRGGDAVYTHTVKRRVNDLRCEEWERVIGKEEYNKLLASADPARAPLLKKRYCISFHGQIFEIDVYPFWEDLAIMEIELRDEAQTVELPPEIELIREVSGDKRYSNSSLAMRPFGQAVGSEGSERMDLT